MSCLTLFSMSPCRKWIADDLLTNLETAPGMSMRWGCDSHECPTLSHKSMAQDCTRVSCKSVPGQWLEGSCTLSGLDSRQRRVSSELLHLVLGHRIIQRHKTDWTCIDIGIYRHKITITSQRVHFSTGRCWWLLSLSLCSRVGRG